MAQAQLRQPRSHPSIEQVNVLMKESIGFTSAEQANEGQSIIARFGVEIWGDSHPGLLCKGDKSKTLALQTMTRLKIRQLKLAMYSGSNQLAYHWLINHRSERIRKGDKFNPNAIAAGITNATAIEDHISNLGVLIELERQIFRPWMTPGCDYHGFNDHIVVPPIPHELKDDPTTTKLREQKTRYDKLVALQSDINIIINAVDNMVDASSNLQCAGQYGVDDYAVSAITKHRYAVIKIVVGTKSENLLNYFRRFNDVNAIFNTTCHDALQVKARKMGQCMVINEAEQNLSDEN